MKKLLSILFFCLVVISLHAQRYDIISQDICWNTGAVDSSLTRYFLVSTRASNVKLLTYLNASGQSVDVSGGGSFAQGHCGCCGGNVSSLPDASSPARSGLTNDNDTLKLGGVVEENTSVSGMNEYGLDITNWKYLNFSASDSFKVITPGLISAAVKVGGLLQVNSLSGRVEFTPYAFPLTPGTDGQFQQLNGTTGELEWRSPYITAEKSDSQYRFSINGSTVSTIDFRDKVLKPEYFGAIADYSRDSVFYVRGSRQIVCSGCNFLASDVGKIVAIKRARIDTSYSMRRVAMNAYIDTVINSTTIAIDSLIDVSGSDLMLWGTNNWTSFQSMFDYAHSNNVRNIELSQGGYYLSPLGVNLDTHAGLKGLIQRGPISIKGNGSICKYGPEDVQRINEADILGYRALYLVEDGHRILENFTIESADRVSTETAAGHTRAIFQEQRSNAAISLDLKGVHITAGNGQAKDGFSHAIESSLGGTWDSVRDSIIHQVTYHIENSELTAGSQVISFFAQDGPCKRLVIEDSQFNGGGIVNTATYPGAASINAGSDTLRINIDTFSFYDIRSQYATDRLPQIVLDNSTDFGTAEIVNRNTVILSTTSANTLSNVDFTWTANSDNVEGHGIYTHPNVSLVIDGLNHVNINGNALNYFSGGGQLGRTRQFSIKNYHATRPDGSLAPLAIVGSNINLGTYAEQGYATFRQSSLLVSFTGGSYAKSRFYNCSFPQGIALGDTSLVENSQGRLRFLGNGGEYRIRGGEHPQIDCEDLDGNYYINAVRGGELILDGAANLYWNGGNLSSIKPPPNPTDLSRAIISNTVLDPGIGQQTYFFSGTSTDYDLLRERLQFKNVSLSGKALSNWSTPSVEGLLEVRQGINNRPISSRTSIVQPSSTCINTDYQALRYLVLPYDFDFHSISISNDSINQLEISENGNINIYKFFSQSTAAFQGQMDLNVIGESFKFYEGGNLRLQHLSARKGVSSFLKTPQNGVWVETTNRRISSSAQPNRRGINGEIVYHDDLESDTTRWEYQLTLHEVEAELHSLSGATLPFEFDLINGKPYMGFEESYYINPDTLFTMSIPLSGGGAEVFRAGNYGELVGSNGGQGNIRLEDGHVKINSLGIGTLDSSTSLAVDYRYVSSAGWFPFNLPVREKGVATTTAGPSTTLIITHNLGQAPTYISITPGGDIGDWYINSVNSTTMTLNYTSTATTNASSVNIYWQVE